MTPRKARKATRPTRAARTSTPSKTPDAGSSRNLTVADDPQEEAAEESAADDDPPELWKTLISSEDMQAVGSAAGNDQTFRTAARHFWNRAYMFHRRWTPADQQYIKDGVLEGLNIQDRTRLVVLLEEARFEAENSLCTTVKAFATHWLEDTIKGRQYAREYEEYRYVPR